MKTKREKNPIELQKLSKENDDQREDRVLLCCLSMVQAVSLRCQAHGQLDKLLECRESFAGRRQGTMDGRYTPSQAMGSRFLGCVLAVRTLFLEGHLSESGERRFSCSSAVSEPQRAGVAALGSARVWWIAALEAPSAPVWQSLEP